jgi:hypothetical protein
MTHFFHQVFAKNPKLLKKGCFEKMPNPIIFLNLLSLEVNGGFVTYLSTSNSKFMFAILCSVVNISLVFNSGVDLFLDLFTSNTYASQN